jgi:hypothetical protein
MVSKERPDIAHLGPGIYYFTITKGKGCVVGIVIMDNIDTNNVQIIQNHALINNNIKHGTLITVIKCDDAFCCH